MKKLLVLFILATLWVLPANAADPNMILDWVPNDSPTGWVSRWGNERWGTGADGAPSFFITPEGVVTNYMVFSTGNSATQRWCPWTEETEVLTNYTMMVWGSADLVKPATGKIASLWCMGKEGTTRTGLFKDSDGNIRFIRLGGSTSNPTIAEEVNYGPVSSGFHLFTVRFNTAVGASIQVDQGPVVTNTSFRTTSGVGIQVGSILGEPKGICLNGVGFVVRRMIAYDGDTISAETYASLCEENPVIPFANTPATANTMDSTFRVLRGNLMVPEGEYITMPAIEFGDINQAIPPYGNYFGMELHGTLNITANQTALNNDVVTAYDACNAGNGINLAEWGGTGSFLITGSFKAPNAIVVLAYSAVGILNVQGGEFIVKGVASRTANNARINLSEGGLINYGRYPSAAVATVGITKNYGYGTVTGTHDWTDTDTITLNDTANGTTFLADGMTQTYSGLVTGTGKAVIRTRNEGEVIFQNYQAGPVEIAEGRLSLPLTQALAMNNLTIGSNGELNLLVTDFSQLSNGQVLFAGANIDPDAQILINGRGNSMGYAIERENGQFVVSVTQGDFATGPVLRFRQIMPKCSDLPAVELNGLNGFDVNNLESGWIEVENDSDQWADLEDYRLVRVNRGKATDIAGYGNFPTRLIPPGGTAIIYTSERYPNSVDPKVSAYTQGTFDGAPKIYHDLGNILVWGDKINPKKNPFVRLYYAPAGTHTAIPVDTVVIPVDMPEGMSIVVGKANSSQSTRRWICPTPVQGSVPPVGSLVKLGPNVGPLYEMPDLGRTDIENEFVRNSPPAVPGTDYPIVLPINPVMNPDGSFAPRPMDVITSIRLVYRKDLDDTTLVTNQVDLSTKTSGTAWGDEYHTSIPHTYFPAAGHLMQWKVILTDAAGSEWVSPAFNNPDDSHEWYGTIVQPGDLNSTTLQTWHLFATPVSLQQMDIDQLKQNRNLVPYLARTAIYDASTSQYYDNVRIELRGTTSAVFTKKSHSLRFSKSHPLTMTDPITGETLDEVRKTSILSEYADPSFVRQMTALWVMRQAGNKVPFHYPIRVNMNGEFYQLGFHSNRFTDELIEDYYGLDGYGYSYKSVGSFESADSSVTGHIEKKTPDDGYEHDISVLQNELRQKLVDNNVMAALENNEGLSQLVVEKYDISAWVNYLAAVRIFQEMDDMWANLCMHYDDAYMKEGVRGLGTWMPLAYDMNLSFGQWHIYDPHGNLTGLLADVDWYKAHPFYSGLQIKCYSSASLNNTVYTGNYAAEAFLQNPKFRRLLLRRLRTLMDQYLKQPGTSESDVPIMAMMRQMADLIRTESAMDQVRWPNDDTDYKIDVWQGGVERPATIDDGIDEIWEDYIVPRQVHLYDTHSVTNTAKEIGYGVTYNAGIPLEQTPVLDFRPAFSASYDAALGALVISNANDEVIDMSNWVLRGPVNMTLPPGTVIDKMVDGVPGTVYVTLDRRATVATLKSENTISDQVIVGNGTPGPVNSLITLNADDAEKTPVLIYESDVQKYLRLNSISGVTIFDIDGDAGEWICLTNISEEVTLNLTGVRVTVQKQGDPISCDFTIAEEMTLAPGESVMLKRRFYWPEGRISSNKIEANIYDADGLVAQTIQVTQKDFSHYYNQEWGYYLEATSTLPNLTTTDFAERKRPSRVGPRITVY